LLEYVTINSLRSTKSAHGLLLALLLKASTGHLGSHSLLQGTGRALSQAPCSQPGTGLLFNHALLLRGQTGTGSQARLSLRGQRIGQGSLFWRGRLDRSTGLRPESLDVGNVTGPGAGAGGRLDLAHGGRDLLLVEPQELRCGLLKKAKLKRLILRRKLGLGGVLLWSQINLASECIPGFLGVIPWSRCAN
jgi:hypothetical protein